FGETPGYLLLDEKGPDHSKCFKISARIGTRNYAPAWGRNKKEAEQRAALNALCQLAGDPLPFESEQPLERRCRDRVRCCVGAEPGGLAVLVAAGVRHLILQVQPVLERADPRPGAAVRAGAGDALDRGQPGESPLECLHLAVHRLGVVALAVRARPGVIPPAA